MNTQLKQRQADRIRQLNDELRSRFAGGVVVTTNGVAALEIAIRTELLATIRRFDRFSAENDPYCEHDFGVIEIGNQTFFFKIDYYDRSLSLHSSDPCDPTVTTRVLTVMLAEEY